MDNKHLMPIQKETKVYNPRHKYDPTQKDEEPKYIVTFDPVKDEGNGISISSCKVEKGVVENLQYEHGKFNVEKNLECFRLDFKEKEPDRLPDSIEKTDDVKFKIEFKDRKVFTKEELAEQYKSQVDTGGSFWDFFKHIGNSNICHFELVHPWHRRYENANIWQSYRDLGDGWYILLTINKESGIVAAFKIFDKYFDINSNADVNGHVLTLYSGNPKDMHEVEKIIKMNTGKTMMINPAPSFMDFIDHGVVVRDNDWLFSTKLAMIGFKDFDQHRRKLAKRRTKQDLPFTTGKFKSFYKRYKMV